ncbi:hypothetical protein C6502_19420 [Candidatus Poribacteria bacterium]|nr:MAG: hypothetical protein C6502_19420 [Candidatus Poribacteria bacterium]
MNWRTIFTRRIPQPRFYRGGALLDFQRSKPHTAPPTPDNLRRSPMSNRARANRRTSLSFFISLLLHLIAVLMVSINLPRWYRPPPPPDSIVAELIEVEFHSQRLHPVDIKKPIFHADIPNKPYANSAHATPLMSPKASAVPVNQVALPVQSTAKPLSTMAHLLPTSDTPFAEAAEDDWRLQESIGEPLETVAEIPQSTSTEVERDLSQIDRPQTDGVETPSLDRDAQMGLLLQTIASGIASEKDSPTVDIVFLLDTSGSMEDNIHAVGRHLVDMVEVFQAEQLDFTMAMVPFKYLAQHFHQPTKDYQRYERLLENLKCSGAERAYNAIVKSITRIKFRPEARRRFILITDAPFTGSYTIQEVLQQCWAAEITLDIIGGVTDRTEADDPLKAEREQKALARKTGGMWFPIPTN